MLWHEIQSRIGSLSPNSRRQENSIKTNQRQYVSSKDSLTDSCSAWTNQLCLRSNPRFFHTSLPSQCASITGRSICDRYRRLFNLSSPIWLLLSWLLLCSRAFICLVPLAVGFLSVPFKNFIYKVFLPQLVSTFEHTSLILEMNLFIYFIPITLHMPKVVNAISIRVPVLQNFPFSLPFALLFFHHVMFCTNNLPCYHYQRPCKMVGSICQGSCNILHNPLTPLTCMAWVQNMSRNAKVKQIGAKDTWGEKRIVTILLSFTTMGISSNVRALGLRVGM